MLVDIADDHGGDEGADDIEVSAVMRKSSKCEILARNSPRWAENAANIWRYVSPNSVLQFSGQLATRNFTQKKTCGRRGARMAHSKGSDFGTPWFR